MGFRPMIDVDGATARCRQTTCCCVEIQDGSGHLVASVPRCQSIGGTVSTSSAVSSLALASFPSNWECEQPSRSKDCGQAAVPIGRLLVGVGSGEQRAFPPWFAD